MKIDVDALKASVDIVSVIGSYVSLKKRGTENVGICPFHDDHNPSFYVVPAKRFYKCFGCGAAGDAIDFVKEFEGVDFLAACEKLGAKRTWMPANLPHIAPRPPDRVTFEPPADAGEPDMKVPDLGGAPTAIYVIRRPDGYPIGYEARYQPQDGKREARLWTWGQRGDRRPRWECGHFNKPRPLYGLEQLAARPNDAVALWESPKKAEAARKLLPTYVHCAWTGGSGGWDKHDLTPLARKSVLLWPDADRKVCKEPNRAAKLGIEVGELLPYQEQPGPKANLGARAALQDLGCTVKLLDVRAVETDGWNICDAEREGWDQARVISFGKSLPVEPQVEMIELAQDAANEPAEDLPPIEAYAQDARAQPAAATPRPPRVNGAAALDEVYFRPMSQIESKAINWLWPGRIAKGKVSMIVGNPGLGKSQVCASLASVVSNGGAWPVDRTSAELGSVVILSAEDDPEDTIRPRLEAAQANLEKIFILDAIRTEREGEIGRRGFDLTMDIKRLGALLHELGDAAMVIIDPITAYLGDADSHKNAEVRALLAQLADMAATQRVAVLAVSHLTKSSGMDALLRVQGSIGFAAAARAVWGVAKDKENPSRRLFMPLKNNLGTDISGFAYSVEGIRLQESDIETSHVMWENQAITMTVDEVFGESNLGYDEKSALSDAKLFLVDLLRNGPLDSKQIEADARGAGHSMTTLRRAAKDLRLRIAKDGFGKGSPWKWWPKQDSAP